MINNMLSDYDIVKCPHITERSTDLSSLGKYVFLVHPMADKFNIRRAVSKIFDVSVIDVNIINQKGKKKSFKGHVGFRNSYKKAIVTLKQGDSIDLTAGV